MKDFPGIPFAALPDIKSPDFVSRLRNMLGTVDAWGRDASVAFARIQSGQVPNASGAAALGYTNSNPRNAGVLQVQPAPGSSADIQQWRTANGTLVMSLGFSGILTYSQIQNLAGSFIISGSGVLVCTGIAVGPSAGVTNLLILSDGSLSCTSINATAGFLGGTNDFDTDGFLDDLLMKDTGTGFIGSLTWAGIASGATIALPTASGTLLSNNNTVSVGAKTLATNNEIRCNTSGGVTFADNSSTTKNMRFNLSGITAGTIRNQKWQDTAGSVVTVGNAASASGVLGTISLTGQTGSLGAQTLLTGNASSAGLYRVSFYLKTTTTGTAGSNVTATLAWNEGTAQTELVGFLGTTSSVVPYTAHDLGTANAFSHASIVVRVAASQNITFTTTITIVGGAPVYTVDARLESLG